MDVVVFGAGALGSLLGGALAREHAVTLVGRDPHMRQVAGAGLRVSGELDRLARPRATTAPDDADLSVDLALVTVKAYDVEGAAAALAAADPGPDLVVGFSNGLTEETLAAALGDRVLAGTATYGAELVEPGEVRCTGEGRLHVGELRDDGASDGDGEASARAERVAAAFRAAGLRCVTEQAMERRRWEKLAVNAGVNAVTALARVPNGALADGPAGRVARRAARETAAVARAEGVDLGADAAVEALAAVVAETAANRSSMLQDVAAGRRTEAAHINGAVAERGREREVATPTNRTLAALLAGWEAEHAEK